jgi:hypothetical protein
MKGLVLLLLLSALIGLVLMGEYKRFSYITTLVNLHKRGMYFEPGIYYRYDFSREGRIDLLFKQMLEDGIPIQEAWYKGKASSCCPPNGGRCLQALVMPSLIVRLKEEDERIEEYGFSRVAQPSLGWCAYNVIHYIFS